MRMFAGLDVGFKRTAMCVLDEAGRIVGAGWWIHIPTRCLEPCSAGAGSLRRSAWKAEEITDDGGALLLVGGA
jgi:hypothetical protein